MLYIFNSAEQLQTILKNEGEFCPYTNPVHSEKLSGENTFTFSVPADHTDSQHVTEGNLVAFKDLDANWQLFEIKRITDIHGDGLTRTAFCEHAFYELIDDFIEDLRPTDVSAHFALTQALTGTRWEPGTVHDLGLNSTNYYYQSALAAVQKVAATWKGELQFRVAVTGGIISNRYVDLLARRGADTGKQFAYGRHTQNIEREVDLTTVATALYGRGKGEAVETGGYGRRTTFASVEWSVANGDPVDKPAVQEWVGDPEALAQWGRPGGRHRFGVFEDPEETDPAVLLQKTWEALQERKNPRVTYRLDVADLERLSGYEHEKVRLGDTVRVIDCKFNPALLVEARVIEIDRHLLRPEETQITLGNFPPTLADDALKQQEVAQTVRDRQGVWDKATAFQPGGIPTSWLDGIIDVLTNQLKSTTSNWYTDENGNLVFETLDGTAAMMLTGNGFMLSNEKDENDVWIWRTFGTGDGFTADELNAGEINTSLIQIIGNSHFYWDGDYLYIVYPDNQNQQIRLSKEGIRFTQDGGQTWNVAMDFNGLRMEGQSQDGHTHYTGDGTKVYDEAGNLVGHLGSFEGLGPQTADFSRASTAYKQDGTQVAANVPRFGEGAFGDPDGAVMVEEGATNVCNPSYIYKDTWTVMDYSWGRVTTINCSAGAVFSISADVRNGSGRFATVRFEDLNGNSLATYYPSINTEKTRQEYTTPAAPVDTHHVEIYWISGPGVTYEGKNFQVEQKPYPTSFTDSTRSPETLTIPTAGVLNPQEGTVECWFYYNPCNIWQRIVSFVGSTLNENRDLQFDISTSGKVRFQPKRSDVETVALYSHDAITEGWHYAVCTWNENEIKIAVDNQPIQKLSYGGGIAELDTYFTIGKEHNSATAFLNSLIDDLRISSIARTDEEILAAYQSGQPLPVDDATTYKLSFDGNLNPTVRDFGLWSKNGRMILQDPQSGQGMEVWDGGTRKVLIGRLDDGTIGQEIRGGKIYSTQIRSGEPGDTDYVEIGSGWMPIQIIRNGQAQLQLFAESNGGYIWLNDQSGNQYGRILRYDDIYGSNLAIESPSSNITLRAHGRSISLVTETTWLENTTVAHNFYTTGTKDCVLATQNFGVRHLAARESPETRFVDEGMAQLFDGECRIDIDPIFLECIEPNTTQTRWLVNVTPYADVSLYVAEVGSDYFIVRERAGGTSNASFAWSLSATRIGHTQRFRTDDENILEDSFEDELLVGDELEVDMAILESNWEDELM